MPPPPHPTPGTGPGAQQVLSPHLLRCTSIESQLPPPSPPRWPFLCAPPSSLRGTAWLTPAPARTLDPKHSLNAAPSPAAAPSRTPAAAALVWPGASRDGRNQRPRAQGRLKPPQSVYPVPPPGPSTPTTHAARLRTRLPAWKGVQARPAPREAL